MNIKEIKKRLAVIISVMIVISSCITGVSVSAEEIDEAVCQLGTTQGYSQAETVNTSLSEMTTVTATEPTENVKASNVDKLLTYSSEVEYTTEPTEEIIDDDRIAVYLYSAYDNSTNSYEWGDYSYITVYYWRDNVDEAESAVMNYYECADEYNYTSRKYIAYIPSDAKYLQFSCEDINKETEVMPVPESSKMYKNGEWVDLTRTINFSDRVTLWGDWDSNSSQIYAYYWSNNNNSMVQWPGIELDKVENYLSADYMFSGEISPEAEYVIFSSSNGAKTSTLTIPKNCYEEIFNSTQKKWQSLWECYGETGEYNLCVVAGDKELCGTDWEYNVYDSYENVMEEDLSKENSPWQYTRTKTYKNVQPANNIQFKVANIYTSHNHAFEGKTDYDVQWFGDEYGNDITFNVTKACDVTITFVHNESYNNNYDLITVTGDGVEMSTDTKNDLFKYRVLDDGTAALVAYTKTGYGYYEANYSDEKVQVTIPTEIDGYNVTALDGTFAYIGWIEMPEIPDCITDIGNCTFMSCLNAYYDEVEPIKFEENIKSIGDFAYYDFETYYNNWVGSDYYIYIMNSDISIGKEAIPFYSTIYGASLSEAETYAKEHSCKFISISSGEIIGDINLKLEIDSNGVFSGETELKAGTYDLKIKIDEKECGGAYTVYDEVSSALFNKNWKKSCTLIATGGKYKFNFDSNTGILKINYLDKSVENVSIIGDIEVALEKTSPNSCIYSAIVNDLSTYTWYNFKVCVDGVEYGNGTTFYGGVTECVYSPSWKKSTSLSVGVSSCFFTYNVHTNKLTVSPYEESSSIEIAGDIELALNSEDSDANIYSNTIYLDQGTYQFNVNVDYNRYCFGYTFTEYISNVQYNLNWSNSTTFIAKGGTYRFTYNKGTNMLTVLPVK